MGLTIFCVVPTTLGVGVALTAASRGNQALALLLTIVTNLLGIVTVGKTHPHLVPGSAFSRGACVPAPRRCPSWNTAADGTASCRISRLLPAVVTDKTAPGCRIATNWCPAWQVPYELKLVLQGSNSIRIDPGSLVVKLLLTVRFLPPLLACAHAFHA